MVGPANYEPSLGTCASLGLAEASLGKICLRWLLALKLCPYTLRQSSATERYAHATRTSQLIANNQKTESFEKGLRICRLLRLLAKLLWHMGIAGQSLKT